MPDDTDRAKRKVKVTKARKPRLRLVAEQQPDTVIHLANGQGKNTHGLTAKQEAFAQGVGTRGETLADAYRAAYDAANMAPATVHSEACRLMANPVISARINRLVIERQGRESHNAERIRQHVTERLHAESIDPDNPPAARVRALELLGKLGAVQAFASKDKDDDAAPAHADLVATLEARLKALLAKAG